MEKFKFAKHFPSSMAIDYLVNESMPGKFRPGNSVIDLALIAREMRPEINGIRHPYDQSRSPTPVLDPAVYAGSSKTSPPYRSNELEKPAAYHMTTKEAFERLVRYH